MACHGCLSYSLVYNLWFFQMGYCYDAKYKKIKYSRLISEVDVIVLPFFELLICSKLDVICIHWNPFSLWAKYLCLLLDIYSEVSCIYSIVFYVSWFISCYWYKMIKFLANSPFHDGGRYYIETSPYDNGLHHERIKWLI